MDKMSAYFLEIINKTITVGITDDLFSDTEKAQIIDDYSEWINKNNDEMATGYVMCTCFMRFATLFLFSSSLFFFLSHSHRSWTNLQTLQTSTKEWENETKIETLHSIYVAVFQHLTFFSTLFVIYEIFFLFNSLFFGVFVDILYSRNELWKQFLANSNENIHFVLLMKPNKAFRIHCRRYPGLIGNTSIDYMRPWSEQVLMKVANVFLAGHPMIAENYLDGIVKHVVHVHRSVHIYSARFLTECDRLNVVTPKHYLVYIHTSIHSMGEQKTQNHFPHFSSQILFHFFFFLFIDSVAE